MLLSSISAWPVYEFGQQGYDRVLSMTDEAGEAWLDEHMHRAENLIWVFYALAALSAFAIAAPIKWPNCVPLAVAAVLLGAVTSGKRATSPTLVEGSAIANFETRLLLH